LLSSWRVAEAHNLDTFVRVGFPVRIESEREVGQLLDSMHEGRFELFLREFDGLQASDMDLLVDALVEFVRFQGHCLPWRNPILPLATMASCLALFRKMRGFSPQFRRVLEVGPGCGYLSFFLRNHPALENYSQIEACESFYLLQSMVNRHLWGGRFVEDIVPPDHREIFSTYVARDSWIGAPAEGPVSLDRSIFGKPICFHFPWWSMARVAEHGEYFDVVSANANLNEMTRSALRDYMELFRRVLSPDGIFLVQCTGAAAHGSVDELFDILAASGFACVFCAMSGEVEFAAMQPHSARYVALNNLVMVREGHLLFKQAQGRDNFTSGMMIDQPWLRRMYFSPPGERVTSAEVVERVTKRLKRSSSGAVETSAGRHSAELQGS
jgi:SAM-dependent methyltransferase